MPEMTDDEAAELLRLLALYDTNYGTSNGRMTVEELRDDLNSSLPARRT